MVVGRTYLPRYLRAIPDRQIEAFETFRIHAVKTNEILKFWCVYRYLRVCIG